MFKFFNNILRIKITFNKPSKADILVYDVNSLPAAKLLFSNFKLNIIHVRYEEINIFLFLKSLLTNPFKIKENYIKNYVKYVNPKLIYSSIDNNTAFFRLKGFLNNNVKIVSDQKAMRDPFFLNLVKKEKNKLACDVSFIFNKNEKNLFEKYINSNFFISGPNFNNTLPKIKKNKFHDIIFISGKLPNRSIDHWNYEKKLFLNLISYCKKNSFRLYFKEKHNMYYEKLNYQFNLNAKKREKIIKNFIGNQDFVFIPYNLNKNSKLFKKLYFDNNLIVFSDSTLGYEFLARGFKCASFTDKFPVLGLNNFFKKKGPFWTNSLAYNEMESLINKIRAIKTNEWQKIYKNYSKQILPYDNNNKYKKFILKNYLY